MNNELINKFLNKTIYRLNLYLKIFKFRFLYKGNKNVIPNEKGKAKRYNDFERINIKTVVKTVFAEIISDSKEERKRNESVIKVIF